MPLPDRAPMIGLPTTILALQGKLDDASAHVVDVAVAAIAPTSSVVVFDLHDVAVVDRRGAGHLGAHAQRLHREGRRVEFINVPAGAAPFLGLPTPDGPPPRG